MLNPATSSSVRSTARECQRIERASDKRHTGNVCLDLILESALWQGLNASLEQPADEYDCSVDTVFLPDLEHSGMLSKVLATDTTEGGESLGLNVVRVKPVYKLDLGVLDGKLHLVCALAQLEFSRSLTLTGNWLDTGSCDELFQLVNVEV